MPIIDPAAPAYKPEPGEALIGARLILFTVVGMSVNIMPIFLASFPVMLPELERAFGASRSGLTLGYALLATSLALFSPVFGRILDATGPLRLLVPAIVALAATFLLFLALPASLPAYLALCTVIGIAGAASYQFVYYSVLPRWFDRRLGLAFGFAGAGAALGLGIVPSYCAFLLRHADWRETYAILGLTSLAVALPNLLLLPRALSSRAPRGASGQRPDVAGDTFRQVIARPVFWQLAASYLLICMLINGHVIHLVPMLVERGVDPGAAAAAMAALGVSMMVSRLACGFLLDYLPPARLGAAVFLVGTAGAVVIWLGVGLPAMIAGIALVGVALGVESELINYMARMVFGLRAYGAVLGALSTSFLLGVILGPMFMSLTHDLTGSYTVGRAVLIALGVVASALHFGVRAQARPPDRDPLDATRPAEAVA